MSTSATKKTNVKKEHKPLPPKCKMLLIYLVSALFCQVFSMVYLSFSHGVSSPYMAFVGVGVLVMGVLPHLLILMVKKFRLPNRVGTNLMAIGVETAAIGSIMKGAFVIADKAKNQEPVYILCFGIGLWLAGLLFGWRGPKHKNAEL